MTTNAIGNNFLSLTGGNRISGIKWNPEVYAGGGVVDTTGSGNVNLESKVGMGACYTHTPGRGYNVSGKLIDYGA